MRMCKKATRHGWLMVGGTIAWHACMLVCECCFSHWSTWEKVWEKMSPTPLKGANSIYCQHIRSDINICISYCFFKCICPRALRGAWDTLVVVREVFVAYRLENLLPLSTPIAPLSISLIKNSYT